MAAREMGGPQLADALSLCELMAGLILSVTSELLCVGRPPLTAAACRQRPSGLTFPP